MKNKIIFISILIFLMIGLSSISAADVDGLNTDDSSDGNVDNFAVDADALTTAEDTSVIENDDNVVEYDEPTAVEKRKSISDGGLKYVNEGNVLSDDDYTIKTYLELNTYNLSSDNPHSVNIYNDSDYVAKLYTYTEAGGSVSLFIGKNEDDAEEIFTSPIQELDKEIDSNDTNYSYYYIRPTDISIAEVPDIYYVLFKYDIGWFSFDSVEGYVHFVEDSRHVRVEAPYEIVIGDDLNSFINVYVEGTRGYLRVLVDGIEIINDSVYNLRYINETDEFRYYIPVFLDYLSVGTHTYNVSYYNGNWDNVTISDTIDVTYLFEVYPNSDEVYCGDNVTFTIILPFDAIGDEIKVNNKTYDINLEYGLAHLTLSDFELGENILVFSYKDQFYDEKSCLVVVDVEPYLYIPELVLCKGDEKIVLRVPSDAQGKLNISTLDEYDWYFVDSVDVVDGEAVYSFDDYPWIIGSHDVLVEFDGDYNLSEETVIKIIPNVLLDERVIDEKLYVLADIIGVLGNVTIFVNDVNWTTVDVGFDGKINVAVPFSELEEGINSITLRHDGDDIDNDPFYYYDEWGERVPYVYEYEYVHKEKKDCN
ncbi:hypothetical protein [uncultured Methanobrevibacter sp.]|uniref:hypothetical protein n=1 Tax=uncultured Methanobrevibacter sp. TaxID=253161 RepID=UPI0025D781DD|nr:hypothetical protein [uncultured Methanobrevibacter sp.]